MPEGRQCQVPGARCQVGSGPSRSAKRLAATFVGPGTWHLAPGTVSLASLLLLTAAPAWGSDAEPQDPRMALVLLLLVPVALLSFTALELVLWVLARGALTATCQAIAQGRGR